MEKGGSFDGPQDVRIPYSQFIRKSCGQCLNPPDVSVCNLIFGINAMARLSTVDR